VNEICFLLFAGLWLTPIAAGRRSNGGLRCANPHYLLTVREDPMAGTRPAMPRDIDRKK
jgi:hypothetical protein